MYNYNLSMLNGYKPDFINFKKYAFPYPIPFEKMLISANFFFGGGGSNGELNKVMMDIMNLINLPDLGLIYDA